MGSFRYFLDRLSGFRIVNQLTLGETQQSWYLRRLFSIFSVNLVIDVGGNAGQYARFLRKRVGYRGSIITFEPIPELAAQLRSMAKGDKQWEIVEAALGESERDGEFNIMKSSPLSSLLKPSASATTRLSASNVISRTIPIRITTLDSSLVGKIKQTDNVYLKLDVQGYERQVLEGAPSTLTQTLALQAELSVTPIYENIPDYKSQMEFIESLGYTLSLIPAQKFRQFPDIVDFDCHFVRRAALQGLREVPPTHHISP
jgi:FkbM family methyltransferase